MNWILITIVGLILLVIIIKLTEVRHHLFYKALGIVLILIGVSVVYILLKSGTNITTYEGFLDFGRVYYNWLLGAFGNAKGITGYAVQQNWGLNSSIETIAP